MGLYDGPVRPQGVFSDEIDPPQSLSSISSACSNQLKRPQLAKVCAGTEPCAHIDLSFIQLVRAVPRPEFTIMITLVTDYADKAWNNLNWMFNTMDVTQWGIVSAVMVTLGFIAIKVR